MHYKRVIPCLDVDAGRVVKGTNFVAIRDAGELRIAWRLPGGGLAWGDALGRVDPLKPLVLEYSCSAPPQADLELYVIAEGDGRPRLLAQK